MTTLHTNLLEGKTPEQALQAFCQAYPFEEAQAALWQCLQPRLLALADQSPGEETDRQLALFGLLEQLLAAVYRLSPGMAAPG